MNLIPNNHAERDCGFSTKHEWAWDEKLSTKSIRLSDNKLQVIFNPVYSTGTAVVKGEKPLEKERHHFWEILIITPIYGTDVMIGVGTENVDFSNLDGHFYALLGQDRESWGFSYKGYIKHDDKVYKYGKSFKKNDLVGVHLDTWNGTLQFFLNREPLGIAFTRLNNTILYPLVSSTMCQCIMTLTYSTSIPVSLQTACLAVLSPLQRVYLSKTFPNLRYLSQSIFADILQKSIDEDDDDDFLNCMKDIIVLQEIQDDFDYARIGCGKKKKY